MIPTIVEMGKEGRFERDLFSSQFEKKRVIRLTGEVDSKLADQILVQLDYLNEKSNDEIVMYINSPGGNVSDGMAIVDAMKRCTAPVKVIVTGMAASMGAFIAAVGGTKGKRFITPNSEMMIHQPLGGSRGQASDIELAAQHIVAVKRKLNQMLAAATGKSIDEVARDTERDYFLNAKEAIAYGLIDHILE